MKFVLLKFTLLVMISTFSSKATAGNEQINFIWKGHKSETKTISIGATPNKNFTVDWGDGNPALSYTIGYEGYIHLTSPVYGNTNEYTVSIIAETEDCSFIHIDMSGEYMKNKEITALDISRATGLVSIICDYNILTILDLSRNIKLTHLSCDHNLLNSLNISKNPALKYLYCSNNELTDLDLSGNMALSYLNCSENQLSILDVSRNSELTSLYCFKNSLTELDISINSNLEELFCYFNLLTELDISTNSRLYQLDCSYNQITILNLTNNTDLGLFSCENNQLSILDLSKCERLNTILCFDNSLTTLKLNPNTLLFHLACFNNALSLSDLYMALLLTDTDSSVFLGTQIWDICEVENGAEIDLSLQAEFGSPGIATVFNVLKEENSAILDTDYTLTLDGKLTFLTKGYYTVEMTNNALMSDSYFPAKLIAGYMVVDGNSIYNNKTANILLYLNRENDRLFIESDEILTGNVEIYNLNGQILMQMPYSENGINVSFLPKGLYIVKIQTSKEQQIRKFIKK